MKYYYLIENHIAEIKFRIYYILFSIIITFIIIYIYVYEILSILAEELINFLIYTDLTEFFISQLELSFYLSLILSVPYAVYNIWLFIKPGLYESEAKKMKIILIITILLYIFNIYTVIIIIIPKTIHFFMEFQYLDNSLQISYLPRISKFLSFIYKIYISFLGLTQSPTIIIILFHYDIITIESMILYRKYFVLIAFVLATLISPPDIMSQFLIAVPIICVYELAIYGILLYRKARREALRYNNIPYIASSYTHYT